MWLPQPGLIFKVLQHVNPAIIPGMALAPETEHRSRQRPAPPPGVDMIKKSPFGVRLWILITALVAVAGGTIYGLSSAWHRVRQLEDRLTASQFEGFRLAGEIRYGLANLNNLMFRYAMLRDSQQWAQFDQASGDLDRWIDAHDPSLNPRSPLSTEQERQAFQELNRAYDEYLSAARAVHSNGQPSLVTNSQVAHL